MGQIKTSISIEDRVSPAFRSMQTVVKSTVNSFSSLDNAISNNVVGTNYWTNAVGNYNKSALEAIYTTEELVEMGFKSADAIQKQVTNAENLEQQYNNIEDNIEDNEEQQNEFNEAIKNGTDNANGLASTIKGIAKAYLGIQGAKKAASFISDSVDAANIQNASETQLKTVLANVAAEEDAYEKLYKKASEIQANGIYGDESMLAGAAEIATYISDTDAISSMMDTLTNYAAGMSGGGELNKQAMVDYATQLGKALDGTYDGLTKKGFTLTDTQKDIIENGTDMQKALVLDDVIAQSWDNLYSTMSNVPEASTIQLSNMWGDIKENIGNKVYPALLKFYSAISSNMPVIKSFTNAFATGAYRIISLLTKMVNLVGKVGSFISDNWSIISPIITGIAIALGLYNAALGIHAIAVGISTAAEWLHNIATVAQAKSLLANVNATLLATNMEYALAVATAQATVAQTGFNTALLACPLTWIIIAIIAIIAIIYAVVAAINKATGSSISATGIIVGVLMTAVAFIWNLFAAVVNFVIDCFVVLWNFIAAFVNFFANVFTDPIGAIARLFFDLVDCILGLLQSLASAIDTIFGSNLAGSVQGWRDSLSGWVDETFGEGEEIMAQISGEDYHLSRWAYSDAYDTGYSWGEGIEDKVSDMFNMDSLNLDSLEGYELADDVANTADNTSSIADSMDITEEDLKYLRDLAEQEVINRYTTASINIEMNNNNNINNENDIDGIVSSLEDKIYEMTISMAEGVHS